MCGKSGKHQEEEEIECEVWYLMLHCSVCKLYLHHACRILLFFLLIPCIFIFLAFVVRMNDLSKREQVLEQKT